MRVKQIFLLFSLLVVILTFFASSALFAQENTVISIAMPDWMTGNIDDELFDEFEAAHPGVNVVTVPIDGQIAFPPSPEYGTEDYLDAMAEYVATGDVLIMSSYSMHVHATRAGYLLDMTPLVATDTTLNEDDFFPAMWQSFQWDMGIWALPISGSFNMFVYNQTMFDDLGVPYPTEDWTFADFADAVRGLTQYDEDGDVSTPGYLAFTGNFLLRSFLGQGFYDSSNFPEQPLLNNPDLAALLDEWFALEQEGVFGGFGENAGPVNFEDVPLTIQQPFNLIFPTTSDEYGGSLLPGGFSGLDMTGAAISAGTDQPELAYALANYLTQNPDFIASLFNMSPARQSMVDAEPSDDFIGSLDIPAEVQPLIDAALMGALPVSEMRFAGYVDIALNNMRDNGVDAETALQEAEEQAIQDLQTAEERRGTETVFVATPVPTPILSGSEIALRFNANVSSTTLPDQDGWDQFVADFVANDPDVGYIELSNSFDSFATITEENDCFYMPFNAISSGNTALVLSLDPFLDADFNFDASDVATGVMPQLQREGLTYAIPMTLQPQVMWYDSERFAEAGLFEPVNGWTVDEFEDALRTLEQVDDDDDTPPFTGGFSGGGYIVMLMAAYGGMPIDAIANPPIVRFTDPTNVEAMQQVLDLARDGLIDYNELGSFSGGGGGFGASAIYDDTLTAFSFAFQLSMSEQGTGDFENPYRLTTYPRGSQYTPVSYGIGTGYISATAVNPEACYRFLSALSMRPDLLGGMPARRSILEDPAFEASQNPDAMSFYQSYFETLEDPNLLVITGNFGTGDTFPGLFVLQLWLYRAFDAYVLEDADLIVELEEAQLFAENYLECTADIPPFDESIISTDEEQIEYFTQFARCAVLVDPELEEFFGFILDDEDE